MLRMLTFSRSSPLRFFCRVDGGAIPVGSFDSCYTLHQQGNRIEKEENLLIISYNNLD